MQQLLSMWLSKWWLIALAVIASVGASVAFSLYQTPAYIATAQVLIDIKSPDPIMGMTLPGQLHPSYIATQVDIVKSRKVVLKVIDNLNLAENETAKAEFAKKASTMTLRDSLVALLTKNLEVKPAKESSILLISFSGADPKFAATVANAFARAYVDVSIALRADPAKESAGWFTGQANELKAAADKAQRRLSEYQRSNGLVSNDERFDVESAKLQEISAQLTALNVQTSESAKRQASARDSQATGSTGQVQEVIGNSLIQALKVDIGRLESRLKERQSVLGSGHPDIVKLEQEVQVLTGKLRAEEASIVGSIGKGFRINQMRQAELKSAFDQQRAKVLSIKQVRDDFQALQREYESAQRAYDNVASRLTQSNLESRVIQSNLSLLSAAIAPEAAASPQTPRNAALAALLGLLAGLGAVVLYEALDRRVRAGADMVAYVDVPLVCVVPKLPSARKLRALSLAPRAAVV